MELTPTARSKKHFEELGYVGDVVERWIGIGAQTAIGIGKKRRDFCGFADLIFFTDHEEVAVQATSAAGVSARNKKILEEPWVREQAMKWLSGGCRSCGITGRRRLVIQGWKKYKVAIDRKHWRPLEKWLELTDFAAPPDPE